MAHTQTCHASEKEANELPLASGGWMRHDGFEHHTERGAREYSRQQCQDRNENIDRNRRQRNKKSKKKAQKKGKDVSPTISTSKPCRLVIKPPKTLKVSPELMSRYLEGCLGDKVKFCLEDTKTKDGRPCQFTFVFQSTNQGRKAEQLLKENVKETGEEIEVTILKKDASGTPATFLVNCKKEVQEKFQVVIEQHGKKINEINDLLRRLRVRKHISLDEYEKVVSERKALEQKKSELEQQQEEFERFTSQLISVLSTQSGKPQSSVEKTINELRKSFGRECHRLDSALPMYAKKGLIIETVKGNQVCVVLGETGSGKSTQMTQYLYEAGFAEKGLIVCTQPRKVAATSLAAHVAREMGGVPGQVVGSHVGGNIQASKTTGIVYATDHVLLNECLKDPNLSKYSCVIIDEAHERSLYSDLLLGMIKKSLAQRPELRVVITSATIDPTLFVAYFDQCPVLKVSGRMFPVDVIWRDSPSGSAEKYLQEAVETVREIHHKEGEGDILVFLTSPVETERACENLAKVEPDPNLVCLPLHGKLRQEEQRKVFEVDTNKRKVVFATNCAETSITIPGIRYVVDTGMVKEMKFDPKRNKSSLEVTTINKSSAEQRKGRAGRTQAGKCYRLYSEEEYAAMEDGSRPEILRVHLGQAVLKLMELGIEDVTQFEFVESPPFESIQLALDALKSLGAITENGKLTDLGHKIARVPVEPRLAKLIFDGIDQEIGADALALAAIATVSGSVFFRMGSEEEKQLADNRKVGFCHKGGDLLTLLEVYRQYLQQPKGKRNKWAFDNSLNAKSLRLTEATVKELKLALKHELNVKVPDAVPRCDDTDLKLQRILVSCYTTNLCVFTGHEKAGYRVVSFNHCVQLHPSSALKFLGATPQFIVFEQLLKTSRDFAINATPVEERWLREMISKGAVEYDMDELISTVMTQVALPCSPNLMTLAFGGIRRTMLDQVEEEVSRSCDDSLAVLEKDEKSGKMKVFVPPNYTAKALSIVGDHLEQCRKSLRTEDKEEQLCQGTRIVWGQGGQVQEVLMPHMYRSVTVADVQDEQVVSDYLRSFGDVVKLQFKQQNDKTRAFATFRRSEDAYKAVESSPGNFLDSDFKVKPNHSIPEGMLAQVPQFNVRAKWLRRPGKGTGSIKFFSDEDFHHTLGSLPSLTIKWQRATFQADKFHPGQIYMRGLHSEVSAEDVKSAIEERLPSVKVKNVIVHRKPAFETTDEILASQSRALQECLGVFATEGRFSVHLVKPFPKNFEGYAHLTFEESEEGLAAVKGLNGKGISGIGIVTLQPNLSTNLLCPRNAFTIIEGEIQARIKELEQTFGKKLVVKIKDQHKYKRVAIEVRSDCPVHFVRATAILNEVINGDEIDCKISKSLEILLSNPVKEDLQNIQKDTGTVISQDWKNKVVKIHGNEANRELAKRAINKFLDDFITNNRHPWEIQLRGPKKPRGLLKALFERFGVGLRELQEIPGVEKVHVEFRRLVLKIISSEEAQETINRYVDECCEILMQDSSPLHAENETQLTCSICLCDLDEAADVYRLACCGHAYDKGCIIQQLKSEEVPLKCITENCDEPIVWRDLQNLLNQSEIKKLALNAVDAYVRGNPDVVKYCPTADCRMVYRVSTDGRRHTCGACLAEICTSCHMQYHSGLTCAMFRSERGVEGRLKEWMMEDPSNRKNCPKCNTPIEKNEGCNHMTCSQCHSHMCWLCLKVFPDGGEVYAHQSRCPRRTGV